MKYQIYTDTVDLEDGEKFVRRFLLTEEEADEFVDAGLAADGFGQVIGLEEAAAIRLAELELQSHRHHGGLVQ